MHFNDSKLVSSGGWGLLFFSLTLGVSGCMGGGGDPDSKSPQPPLAEESKSGETEGPPPSADSAQSLSEGSQNGGDLGNNSSTNNQNSNLNSNQNGSGSLKSSGELSSKPAQTLPSDEPKSSSNVSALQNEFEELKKKMNMKVEIDGTNQLSYRQQKDEMQKLKLTLMQLEPNIQGVAMSHPLFDQLSKMDFKEVKELLLTDPDTLLGQEQKKRQLFNWLTRDPHPLLKLIQEGKEFETKEVVTFPERFPSDAELETYRQSLIDLNTKCPDLKKLSHNQEEQKEVCRLKYSLTSVIKGLSELGKEKSNLLAQFTQESQKLEEISQFGKSFEKLRSRFMTQKATLEGVQKEKNKKILEHLKSCQSGVSLALSDFLEPIESDIRHHRSQRNQKEQALSIDSETYEVLTNFEAALKKIFSQWIKDTQSLIDSKSNKSISSQIAQYKKAFEGLTNHIRDTDIASNDGFFIRGGLLGLKNWLIEQERVLNGLQPASLEKKGAFEKTFEGLCQMMSGNRTLKNQDHLDSFLKNNITPNIEAFQKVVQELEKQKTNIETLQTTVSEKIKGLPIAMNLQNDALSCRLDFQLDSEDAFLKDAEKIFSLEYAHLTSDPWVDIGRVHSNELGNLKRIFQFYQTINNYLAHDASNVTQVKVDELQKEADQLKSEILEIYKKIGEKTDKLERQFKEAKEARENEIPDFLRWVAGLKGSNLDSVGKCFNELPNEVQEDLLAQSKSRREVEGLKKRITRTWIPKYHPDKASVNGIDTEEAERVSPFLNAFKEFLQ